MGMALKMKNILRYKNKASFFTLITLFTFCALLLNSTNSLFICAFVFCLASYLANSILKLTKSKTQTIAYILGLIFSVASIQCTRASKGIINVNTLFSLTSLFVCISFSILSFSYLQN